MNTDTKPEDRPGDAAGVTEVPASVVTATGRKLDDEGFTATDPSVYLILTRIPDGDVVGLFPVGGSEYVALLDSLERANKISLYDAGVPVNGQKIYQVAVSSLKLMIRSFPDMSLSEMRILQRYMERSEFLRASFVVSY